MSDFIVKITTQWACINNKSLIPPGRVEVVCASSNLELSGGWMCLLHVLSTSPSCMPSMKSPREVRNPVGRRLSPWVPSLRRPPTDISTCSGLLCEHAMNFFLGAITNWLTFSSRDYTKSWHSNFTFRYSSWRSMLMCKSSLNEWKQMEKAYIGHE